MTQEKGRAAARPESATFRPAGGAWILRAVPRRSPVQGRGRPGLHGVRAGHGPHRGLVLGSQRRWCLDARHAKAALSLQLNKSDRNDARGLAQIVRTGWYREVAVKSFDSQLIRSLLTSRAQLVRMRVDLANQIRGVLKPFGLIACNGGGQAFADRVRALVANGPLQTVAEALLAARQAINSQVAILTRRLIDMARQDQAVKRLMTTPGVGTLVALTYVSVIDQPGRFAKSSSVGAYLGLTPRRFQSG